LIPGAVLEFDPNHPASLAALFASHPGEIAAVLLAPERVLPHVPATFHALSDGELICVCPLHASGTRLRLRARLEQASSASKPRIEFEADDSQRLKCK
jgi:hypothetical protein